MILRPAIMLIVLGLAIVAAVAPGSSQPDGGHPWWPPTVVDPAEFASAWAIRIPLEVRNPTGLVQPAGTPVQVHLDAGALVIQAGWPASREAATPFPRSFHMDPDSVRLIRYSAGWGSILDETPVRTVHSWLEPDQTETFGRVQSDDFHPQRNAILTLEWLLPEALPAFDFDYYDAYVEITENSDKSAASVGRADAERLDAPYWSGPGTTFFGHHPGASTIDPTVLILGLQDATAVTVSAYRGAPFAQPDNRPNSGNPENPFQIAAGQVLRYSLGVSETHYRVDADKPVLVLRHGLSGRAGAAFVPSTSGGYVSTHFQVPAVADAIYVLAPPQTPTGGANVEVTAEGGGTLLSKTMKASSYAYVDIPFDDPERSLAVTSDSPVLVQYVPDQEHTALAQAPSVLGSPVGDAFMAATMSTNAGRLVATAQPEPTHLRITDKNPTVWREIADDVRIAPAGTAVELPASDVPLAPQSTNLNRFSIPVTVERLTEPDAPAGEEGAFQLSVGTASSQEIRQSTPYGGRHGTHFHTQGPSVAFPFYDVTRIDFIHHWDGGREESVLADEGNPIEIPVGVTDVVEVFSDKPLAVVPLGGTANQASFEPAKPAFLVPTIHPAEYRGFLIDMRPEAGVDPVFFEGLPGATVRVPFIVQNLGKWTGGTPLEDTIDLTVAATPEDFSGFAEFEEDALTLDHNEPRETHLDVQLPADMPANSQVSLTVRAVSRGNPNMQSEFTAIVSVRQTFGVQLWFGSPASTTGPDFASPSLPVAGTRNLDFVLKNTGSSPDRFQFVTTGGSGGWEATVVDAQGTPVTEVGPVPAGEQLGLDLRIRAPATDQVGQAIFTVEASSVAKPTATDKLLVNSKLSLGTGIEITSLEPFQDVEPGATVAFQADLANTGQDAVSVLLGLVHALPLGWAVTIDGTGDPDRGAVSLFPGDEIPVRILLTAPAEAQAGRLATFLVTADGTGDQRDVHDGLGLGATVLQVHELGIALPGPYTTTPTEVLGLQIDVTNQGNGLETVHLQPTDLPGGWAFGEPDPVSIPVGEDARRVEWNVTTPAGEPAAAHTLGIDLVTADGVRFPFTIEVEVLPARSLEWDPADDVLLQPGDQGKLLLRLVNEGNARDEAIIQATGPDGWAITADPEDAVLEAGAGRPVTIRWTTPEGVPVGDYEIEVAATSRLGGDAASVTIPVRVGVPMVTIDEVLIPQIPTRPDEVVFLTVLLHNPSDVPARDLEVRLQANATTALDTVRFDSLGPDATAVAALRTTAEPLEAEPTIVWGLATQAGFVPLGSRNVTLDAATELNVGGDAGALAGPAVLSAVLCLVAALAIRRGRP